jgi:hypothetical protein
MVHTRGGSRVLHTLNIHHSREAFEKEVENIQSFEHPDVCKEVAAMLCIASTLKYGAEYRHLGLVGKYSTGKWDREDSEAFISYEDNLYHLKLDILDIEEFLITQRETSIPLVEDYAICQAVINIITNGAETMPELGKGFMKKINLT